MAVLLGIDFETTGLDPKKDKIIEVGFCLWSTDLQAPMEMGSYLVYQPVTLSEQIVKITGITQEMVECGYPENRLISDLLAYHSKADYWVAHNAPFEAGFIQELFGESPLPEISWIDTKNDIPGHQGKRLIHAAAEEGMVNPFPHRALPDVLTMLTLLSKFDFAEVERYATSPTQKLVISFPYDPDKVAAVKTIGGWGWEASYKRWYKNVKDHLVQEEIDKAKAAGFNPYIANNLGEIA